MWSELESRFSIAPIKDMMHVAEDSMFQSRIQEMIALSSLQRHGPTKLLDHLYIGSLTDAKNVNKLRTLGITHIYNLAASKATTSGLAALYGPDSGIVAHKEVAAEDKSTYDILQHYEDAQQFINTARQSNGKVLVHCALGINRSGAICTAYVMLTQQWDLLKAVHYVHTQRGMVLTNQQFQKQLIHFARDHNCLFPP